LTRARADHPSLFTRLTPQRAVTAVGLFVLVGVALWHAQGFRCATLDDAFITYRHAQNLAAGDGPVFNPGERVEGSSSFLMVALLAALIRLGADVTIAAPWLGMMCFAGTVAIGFASVRAVVRGWAGVVLGLGTAAIVAAATPLAYFAATGMETLLYSVLLVTAAWLEALRRQPGTGRAERGWAAPVTWGLAALARPEGAAMFAAAFGVDLAASLFEQRAERRLRERAIHAARRAARRAGWFALVAGPVLVFRVLYFRAWVPNPVIAKAGGMTLLFAQPWRSALSGLVEGDGVALLVLFGRKLGVVAVIVLAALGAAGLLSKATRRAALFMAIPCAGCAAVILWNEGDWFPHFRLLVPAIAPMIVLAALGMSALLSRVERRLPRLQPLFLVSGVGLSALLANHMYYDRHPELTRSETAEYMVWLGRSLRTVRRPDDLLATDMAGLIPFYSELPTLDTFGLCDAHIARHGERYPPMGKMDWPYVYKRRPTFYQLNFVSEFIEMYEDRMFEPYTNDYWAVLTPAYVESHARDRKLLLVRKDRPGLDELTRALGATLVDARKELRAGH